MEEGKKKVVLVAIDESECSHYALEWTLLNLRDAVASADSELLLLAVQPISDYSYLYASSMGATPPELVKIFQDQQRKTAEALLQRAKDMCTKHGIAAKTLTEVGDPKTTICEAVEKHKVHMLVLGSNGKGVLERTFLGSVSNYCVHNAKTSVLVVRKPS